MDTLMPIQNPKRKRAYPTLRHWRGALTQAEAAERLGVRQGHYSRLERGVQYPGRKLGIRIAELTNVPLETVLGVAS